MMTDVYLDDSIRRIDTSIVHLLLERRFGDPIGKRKAQQTIVDQ